MKIIRKYDTTKKIIENTKFKHGKLIHIYFHSTNMYCSISWKMPFVWFGRVISEDAWCKRKLSRNNQQLKLVKKI